MPSCSESSLSSFGVLPSEKAIARDPGEAPAGAAARALAAAEGVCAAVELSKNRMRMNRSAMTPLASVKLGSLFERIRNRVSSVPFQSSLYLRGILMPSCPLIDNRRSTSLCVSPDSLASPITASRLSISPAKPNWSIRPERVSVLVSEDDDFAFPAAKVTSLAKAGASC